MKWTAFMPVLNEGQIIESKIKHLLDLTDRVVVVEGSVPQAYETSPEGLSADNTTEILESYSDKIVHIKAGKCKNKIELQNHALGFIHKNLSDTEILHRTDADEFCNEGVYNIIESCFARDNNWLIYTDLINLVDATSANPNTAPQGIPFPFCKGKTLVAGRYHERFYRYRPDLHYGCSPQCLDDGLKRPLFCHPDYYFNREVLQSARIFHYKYVDGLDRLLKTEMGYLQRDMGMIPHSNEIFEAAKLRLKRILENPKIKIAKTTHCKHVRESDWFKYEPIKWNWDLDYDDWLGRQ